MKNLLIATALVSIAAGSAFAETPAVGPNVKVGGIVGFQVGGRHQKAPYRMGDNAHVTQNQKNWAFNHDARVYVSADAMADAGFKYGAVAGLKTKAQARTGKDSNDLDNTYLFVETNMGRVEAGSNYSAARAMKIDAGSFARGPGGISGDYTNFVNTNWYQADANSTAQEVGPFVLLPRLLGDYNNVNGTNTEQSRKVTFYSPRMSGLQLGVSYTLDSANVGDRAALNSANATLSPRQAKNIWSGGLNYSTQYDQVAVNLSAVGEMGKGIRATGETVKHNLKGYELGGSLTYAGFTAGGSWGTSNKKFFNTATTLNANNKDVKYWDAGLAYVQGPVGVSVNYLNSNFQNNKAKVWSVSADYQLAPGMSPYVEVTNFELRSNASDAKGVKLPKNKGQAYLVGTQLRF
jgi:hypothetical protein